MYKLLNKIKGKIFNFSSPFVNLLIFGFSLIFIFLISHSCYYDSEEYLYPKLSNTCDTTDVTFSSSVKPILQQYCYICHSNSNSVLGGGIKLEDYADVKTLADNGRLYGSVAHLSGYSPMPQGGSILDDCNLNIIKTWIDSGSANN